MASANGGEGGSWRFAFILTCLRLYRIRMCSDSALKQRCDMARAGAVSVTWIS
jgi:hypothetical protein